MAGCSSCVAGLIGSGQAGELVSGSAGGGAGARCVSCECTTTLAFCHAFFSAAGSEKPGWATTGVKISGTHEGRHLRILRLQVQFLMRSSKMIPQYRLAHVDLRHDKWADYNRSPPLSPKCKKILVQLFAFCFHLWLHENKPHMLAVHGDGFNFDSLRWCDYKLGKSPTKPK